MAELTYDELYQLVEWLNNHHEACLNWPGMWVIGSNGTENGAKAFSFLNTQSQSIFLLWR